MRLIVQPACVHLSPMLLLEKLIYVNFGKPSAIAVDLEKLT
jgi:hypothetical protein